MPTMRSLRLPVIATALAAMPFSMAAAGVIIDTTIGPLQGGSTVIGGSPAFPPPAPNNSTGTTGTDPNPSSNTVVVLKDFHSLAPIDITYTVLNTPGTTEYFFSRDLVFNNTGRIWRDFHHELGFLTPGGFQLSNVADGLSFDFPTRDPTPTSTDFALVVHGPNNIDWAGLLEDEGRATTFTFSIDVPNFNTDMPASARVFDASGAVVGYKFTLRQRPTVDIPEPWTITLLSGAGLALWVCSGRRSRMKQFRG